MNASLLLPPTCLLLLCACAVGPDYRAAPQVAASEEWVTPAPATAVDEAWWQSFADPTLTGLIEAASGGNLDLRSAATRLAEARANRDIAAGARLPELQAAASGTRLRQSRNGQIPIGNIPGFARDLDLFDAGFDASFEVDLWGRTRRSVQGATARVAAAQAEQGSVLISLRAEVARTYVDLRAAQGRLESLQTDADAQAGIAALARQRFDAGEVARLDMERAEGLARATAAQLPALQGEVSAAIYRLALLSGAAPGQPATALLTSAPIPAVPDTIAVGLRSELLRRRPDIQVAERRLAAATADIGVATADLFPRLSLVGSIGQQAQHTGDLGSADSTRYSLGPRLSWPVFDRARIHAAVRAAEARRAGAALGYESAVLTALSDSETAANRFARSGETLAGQRSALQSQGAALQLARQRYRAGESDLVELLTVESSYAGTRRAVTDAEAARATQAIALFKALGAGSAPR